MAKKHLVSPSLAWLTVFVPALAYFLVSRLANTRLSGRSLGLLVQDELMNIESLEATKKVFYIANKNKLHQGLHLVHSQGLDDIVSSTWKHDEELGRGFLLLSQSAGAGRIWRWEVGGGPIAIGKTLHMEPSGCRSNKHLSCDNDQEVGSGGLAMDFSNHATSAEGRLVVAEWGEGRIVRMEESGARTPLVMQVPSLCQNETMRRIHQPTTLLYTTFGDLIVSDYDVGCEQTGLYYLDNAMSIAPLASALDSRKAHSWPNCQNHDIPVRILFAGAQGSTLQEIGGMHLDSTWTGLYVMVKLVDGPVQLLHLNINDDDDEPLWNGESEVVYEWKNAPHAGPIAIDAKGNLFVAVDGVLVVFSSATEELVSMKLPGRATSLTIGEDHFLYISTYKELHRIKVRNKALKIPTNLAKKKKKTSSD